MTEYEFSETERLLDLETPVHFLKRRLIRFQTMEPSLRFACALGVFVLIVSAALILVRDRSLSVTTVDAGSLRPQLPTVTYFLTIAFLALAWSYLLTGALHAHAGVRISALIAFTLFVVWVPSPGGFVPAFNSPPTL